MESVFWNGLRRRTTHRPAGNASSACRRMTDLALDEIVRRGTTRMAPGNDRAGQPTTC